MTYLFIGPDISKKDAKIAEIKNKLFKDPSAVSFDHELLHAHKLDPDDLKKSLITLPHLAPVRLIVLRQCERLTKRSRDSKSDTDDSEKLNAEQPQRTTNNDRNREIILEFLSEHSKTTVLVLDFDKLDLKSAFYAQLRPLTETMFFGSNSSQNVFDMADAISARNTSEALKILHELLGNNIHPLQIMGGLVWYWGKERARLTPQCFLKGLSVLEEADLNIKRSRLKPEYAVEKVVVELTMLQGS